MTRISLKAPAGTGYTLIPDAFIKHYMVSASGEFVKVYLYVLCSFRPGGEELDLEAMADHLLCNERDIVRALRYWQKQGLLSLQFTPEGELSGLEVLTPPVPGKSTEEASPADEEKAGLPSSGKDGQAGDPQEEEITAERARELQNDQTASQILFITEQYIGRPLTSNEMRKILYFYDGLSMPAELIEYLIEYCVSRNHKSIRYMETIALSWSREGIRTVEEAKEASSKYQKEYYIILKYMGITGRGPVAEEIRYMDRWCRDYSFPLDMIQEACSRAVINTGQSSFPYTDKILSEWKKHEIRTIEEARLTDQNFRKRKKTSDRGTPASRKGNRFNNFPQRQYDFDEYEKQLLN